MLVEAVTVTSVGNWELNGNALLRLMVRSVLECDLGTNECELSR